MHEGNGSRGGRVRENVLIADGRGVRISREGRTAAGIEGGGGGDLRGGEAAAGISVEVRLRAGGGGGLGRGRMGRGGAEGERNFFFLRKRGRGNYNGRGASNGAPLLMRHTYLLAMAHSLGVRH
jgi:hypothetical protein